MANLSVSSSLSIQGQQFRETDTVEYDVGTVVSPELAAAPTGTLSTRTSSSVGTLTMATGHGIATADKIDIYWINADRTVGVRYGVTVGTVATNSVPFSLGAGDNLPDQATSVTAQTRHSETVSVVGNNLKGVGMTCDGPSVIELQQADGTVIATFLCRTAGDSYQWTTVSGATNPAAGVTIGKVTMTQGDSVQAHSPVCALASV